MALFDLKKARINSLTDTTDTAIRCNEIFDEVAEQVLAEGDWSFARKRASLPQSSETPAFGFNYAHTLPTDVVRVWTINGTNADKSNYAVEDNEVLSDYATMDIKYTYLHTNVSRWPATFKKPFIKAMALALAYYFRSDKVLTKGLEDSYKAELMMGLSLDAKQDSNDYVDVDDLDRVR